MHTQKALDLLCTICLKINSNWLTFQVSVLVIAHHNKPGIDIWTGTRAKKCHNCIILGVALPF